MAKFSIQFIEYYSQFFYFKLEYNLTHCVTFFKFQQTIIIPNKTTSKKLNLT